jgi:lipid II:glycine glycyltransferase (peptidoglycan interpeptide bridge formation enzyme)
VREDIFASRLARRSKGQVLAQQPNVVVRLKRSSDEIWRTYKPKVRKNVSRAKECGLRVVFDGAAEYLDSFLRVYYETMQREDASKSFFISHKRFVDLGNTLGSDGGLLYAHVFDGDDCVSTELLLLSNDTVYSFLGGTLTSAFDKRPNDLLKHEVILWAREKGFEWYVLGGGITAGDGIFKYKASFDPGSIFQFNVRRVIHNKVAYDSLTLKRFLYEKERGNDWCPRSDYFPEYLS